MRWHPKPRPSYFPGDYRTITVFLWLPRKIDGETRWLERATIKQYIPLGVGGWLRWFDCEWVNP